MLNVLTSPKVPHGVPPRLAPIDSQLSSKKIEAVRVAERAHDVERRRVAEDADGHHHPRPRRQRRFELRHVHVQRVELDVDEPQLQPVLLQRMEGRRPRDGRHDDFVAALQRPVARRGTAPRRRPGSPTSPSSPSPRASTPNLRGERLLEAADVLAHREPAARAATRAIASSSSWSPGRAGQVVEHVSGRPARARRRRSRAASG